MKGNTIQKPVDTAAERLSEKSYGFLSERQFRILSLRSRGYTQLEIAKELHTSRANVSMLEGRARKRIELARQTLKVFEECQTHHVITIEPSTRLQKIPMDVLLEADKFQIHMRSNMVEILRMVKKQKPDLLSPDGKTVEKITFDFNERGKLSLL